MNSKSNPWVDRFGPIANIKTIREKTQLRVDPLYALESISAQEAADRIKDAWEGTFYPTERSCEIMQEAVHTAASHAARHHPNSKAHITQCYAGAVDIEPYVPMLLNGLAGTGKTQLRKAIERLFPSPSTIGINDGHGEFPLVSLRSITVRGRSSVESILRPLASPAVIASDKAPKLANLYESCAHWQYVCGVSCISVDELQFLTQSKTANTLVTQVLLGLSYVKVPYLVVANYSLVHRLKRRNSEELQRLLGRPIVLLPDGPDTKDWSSILHEYQRVVPGVYGFEFSDCAAPLWSFTAGLKRELVKLLVLSYKLARRSSNYIVVWRDVESAYLSAEYSVARSDVEMLILHGVSSAALREDLRCPFPMVSSEAEKFNAALRASREAKVAVAALQASITVTERKAVDFVKNVLDGSASVIAKLSPSAPRKKQVKSTAESMKSAGEWFRKRS